MKKLIEQNTPDTTTEALQEIVNKAVEAITRVHDTTDLLEEKALQLRNHELIVSDDEKMGHSKIGAGLKMNLDTYAAEVDEVPIQQRIINHDQDELSHGDVREKLEEIPVMINAPTISGPTTVKINEPYNFQVEATVNFPGIIVNKLSAFMPDGTIVSKSGVNVVDGYATLELTFKSDAIVDETQRVRFMAYDTNGSPSEASYLEVFVSTNTPPNLEELVCTGYNLLEPGGGGTFTISGGLDAEGDVLDYSITVPGGSPLSITPTSGLSEGSVVDYTVAASASRGSTVGFTVTANDRRLEGTSIKTFQSKVNTVPVMTHVSSDIPYYLNSGKSIDMKVYGATSEFNLDLTYSLSSNTPGITFSKSSGIHENEVVQMILDSSVPYASDVQVIITATDSLGASNNKTQSCVVNTPPSVSDMEVHITSDPLVPGATYPIQVEGGTTNVGSLKYRVDAIQPNFSFDKNSNISSMEAFNVTVTETANASRGSEIPLRVYVVDERGGETYVNHMVKINTLPVINMETSVVWNTIPPDNSRESSLFITDPEIKSDYTISLASQSDGLEIDPVVDIEQGDRITFFINSTVTRGTVLSYNVSIHDGYENHVIPRTVRANMIPEIGTVTMTNSISECVGGQQGTLSFSGNGTDDNLSTLKYELVSDTAGVVFSKNIIDSTDETVHVTFPKVAVVTECTISIYALDECNERSAESVDSVVTINPIIKTTRPVITYPTAGITITNTKSTPTFDVSLTSYQTYIELDNDASTDA